MKIHNLALTKHLQSKQFQLEIVSTISENLHCLVFVVCAVVHSTSLRYLSPRCGSHNENNKIDHHEVLEQNVFCMGAYRVQRIFFPYRQGNKHVYLFL